MGTGRPEWRPRLAPADAAALGVEALRCAAAACSEAAALPYSRAPPAALRSLVSLAKVRVMLAAAVVDLEPSVLPGRDQLLGSALQLWRPPSAPEQEDKAPEQPQEPSAGLVTSLAAGYMRGLEAATRSCNRDMILEVTSGRTPHVWTQALALARPREAASLLASLAKVLRRESAELLEAAAEQLAVNAVATDPGGSGGGSKGSGGNGNSSGGNGDSGGGSGTGDGGSLKAPGFMRLYVHYIMHAEMLPVAKCFLGLGLKGWDWLRQVAAADDGRDGPTWEASAADSSTAAVSGNGSERWSVRSGAHSGHMTSDSDDGGNRGCSIGPCGVAGGDAGEGGNGASSDGGQASGGGGCGSSGTCDSSSGGGAGARVDTRLALSVRALARIASCAVVHLGPALSLVPRRMRACDGALGGRGAGAQRDVAAALLSLVPVLAVAAAADAAGRSPRAATGTGLGHRGGGGGQGGDGDGSSNTAGGSGGSTDGGGIAGRADCGSAVIRDPLARGTDGRQLDGGRQSTSAAVMAAAEWRHFLLCDMGLREVLGAALGLVSSVPARERERGEAELQAALASCLRALAWLLPGELASMLAAEGQAEAAEGGQEAGAAAPSVAAPALSQLRALLGPGGSMADPELLAAVEAACGGGGSGGVGAEAKPLPADVGEWAPLAALLAPPSEIRAALPVCSNPLCANLEGGSEAALRLRGCAGCGEVARYCSRSCQVAHWRAGHSKECTGKGRAAAVGAGGL